MKIFVVDVSLVRGILPLLGVGFVLWGAVDGAVGLVVAGAIAVAVSAFFWHLPSEEENPSRRRR